MISSDDFFQKLYGIGCFQYCSHTKGGWMHATKKLIKNTPILEPE